MKLVALLIFALFCGCVFGQQSTEATPASIAIVIDTSGSMGQKVRLARQLISQLARPAHSLDEFALIQASDRPIVLSGFASTGDALQTQLGFTQSKGRSALLDAIYLGVQIAKTGRNARKAVLVISDGGENSSRYSEIEVKNAISEARVGVYAIGVDEAAGAGFLPQIADYARGRYFDIRSGSDATEVASNVSMAVREQR
jgi:Ca-activated chloride channel homolog